MKIKKTKQLKMAIEELTRRIAVLEFKEKAKGENYITSIYSASCYGNYVCASFIHNNRVVYDQVEFPICARTRIVGNYIEVYDAFAIDYLYAVLTRRDDKLVEVDIDLYKKAKLYDETTATAEDKGKENETNS